MFERGGICSDGLSEVRKFNPDGTFVSRITGCGEGADVTIQTPIDVAADSEGMLYVLDSGNGRVQVFEVSG